MQPLEFARPATGRKAPVAQRHNLETTEAEDARDGLSTALVNHRAAADAPPIASPTVRQSASPDWHTYKGRTSVVQRNQEKSTVSPSKWSELRNFPISRPHSQLRPVTYRALCDLTQIHLK